MLNKSKKYAKFKNVAVKETKLTTTTNVEEQISKNRDVRRRPAQTGNCMVRAPCGKHFR